MCLYDICIKLLFIFNIVLNIAREHIKELNKLQEEDRRLMVDIIANGKDIIEFNNKLINDNKNLRETPEQKSK